MSNNSKITANNSALAVENFSISYGEMLAVDKLSFSIEKGKIAAIAGPNGAGKSTFLKGFLGLLPTSSMQYSSASILGHSLPLSKHARLKISYLPQESSLDWHFPLTVLDCALMGSYAKHGWLKPIRRTQKQATQAALEKLGIADLSKRPISDLSLGQRQRLLLARALVQNAEVYLMDEPLNSVDAKTEQTLVQIWHELQQAGKTIVVVHHNLQTLPRYFDYTVFMNKQLIAAGTPKEAVSAENLRLAYGVDFLL